MNNHSKEKREEALLAISLWQESDLSQGAFCRREGISRSTFQHWRKRYDPTYEYRSEPAEKPASSSKQSFIALEVKTPIASSSDELEIIYPNGVRIKCNSSINDERLRKLISLDLD